MNELIRSTVGRFSTPRLAMGSMLIPILTATGQALPGADGPGVSVVCDMEMAP